MRFQDLLYVLFQDVNKFFKGDIAKVMMWDRKLEESEIRNIYKRPVRDGLKLFYDFNLGNANDLSGNENHGKIFNCIKKREVIKVPRTIIPHRIKGRIPIPREEVGVHGPSPSPRGSTSAAATRRACQIINRYGR